MAARCHVAFGGLAGEGVDGCCEEVGFAVLAAEVLGAREEEVLACT